MDFDGLLKQLFISFFCPLSIDCVDWHMCLSGILILLHEQILDWLHLLADGLPLDPRTPCYTEEFLVVALS